MFKIILFIYSGHLLVGWSDKHYFDFEEDIRNCVVRAWRKLRVHQVAAISRGRVCKLFI